MAICSLFISATLLLTTGLLASDISNAFLSTWIYDKAASKIDAKTVYTERTIRLEKTAEGLRMTSRGVTVDGRDLQGNFLGNFDGKDYPVYGNLGPDAIALTAESATQITFITKLKGTVLSSGNYEIRKRGQVLALTTEAKTSDGSIHQSIAIFNKQRP